MSKLKFVYDKATNKGQWVELDNYSSNSNPQPSHALGKDPTIDQYISDHGGIKSHLDNKVYTTKSAYLDHIKSRGCHIHE